MTEATANTLEIARPPTPLEWLLDPNRQVQIASVAGVLLFLGMIVHWLPGDPAPVASAILIWSSLGVGAVHGLRAALESVRAFRPSIDLLMVVGAGLAAAIGHPEEGALLLFMFTLAGGLEHRAMTKARDAVSRLQRLMPRGALRKEHDEWVAVEAESLRPGDLVLVRPGETVPADARVTGGRSHVDQRSLTGESLPRAVQAGDEIFAGTLSIDGALEAEVVREVASSSIRRILQLVLEAQERRQPIQRLIDRLSVPYSSAVMIGGLVSIPVLLWFGLTGAEALYRAITLLVVASPCALVIATPTATLCGLSRAAREGVLIKGGDALERLSRVRTIAVDKTGTLTTGEIEVVRVEPIGAADEVSLLRVALAAEQRSTHPIAAAIVHLAERRQLDPAPLLELANIPGRGIEGRDADMPVRIGTYEFCEPLIPTCFRAHTRHLAERIRADGGMAVVIAARGQALVLALADTPRAGAAALASGLHDVGVDRIAMLTGDHEATARQVATQLGITEVHAGLLPEDKVEELRRLRAEGAGRGGLAVVGDGVNDAPALAVADVGLAMGAIGADAALETADVVLLHDDLDRIPWSIGLARRVRRVLLFNLVFATAVIGTLAVLTLIGILPLGLGVVGHEGSTLLVVGNSLRLLAHPGVASRLLGTSTSASVTAPPQPTAAGAG